MKTKLLKLLVVMTISITALLALGITASAETVGAFEVTGGTNGTDYTYENGVLTINTSTALTIKNTNPSTPTTDRIEVATGISANITLAGVNIDVSATENTAAFKIADNSTGNVTITLADGKTNTLKSGTNCAGLQKNGAYISETQGKLTITGTGSLTATGGESGAGIGGGFEGNGSNIEISGGKVTATGGDYGSGIGGGDGCDGSYITISGGEVTATCGEGGAGIGGGGEGSGSYITISGGEVTATGGEFGAGIGGGFERNGSNIEISGGNVTATSVGYGAGIGGGDSGSGSYITISGGEVTATGGDYGAGIGGGFKGNGSNIEISGGVVTAQGGDGGAGIGGGGFKGYGSNIEISGGSVKAVAGEGIEDEGTTYFPAAIGQGVQYDANTGVYSNGAEVTPTDGNPNVYLTDNAYLLELDVDGTSAVTINGKAYPTKHIDENKLYVYLPAGNYTVANGNSQKLYTIADDGTVSEVNAEDPVCTCTAKCTEDNKNTECPVCNADYSACEYIPTSGNCGAVGNEEDVTWNFDTATGTLTISGTGDMADYDADVEYPVWSQFYRESIKKIVIGYGVTRIGTDAFFNCTNAEEVVFERNENGESSVTSIGNCAVMNCFSLTEIEIPASVETIGDYAFRGCGNLTTVTFEEGSMLTSIGKQCFYANASLEECIIPSEVTSIGDHAFRSNPALKRFYYPAGVNFGTNVFYSDSLLEYFGEYTVNENDKTCSIKYIGVTADGSNYTRDENAEITASEIVIPEKIDGYKVTSVEIDETAVNILPESFEAPHTTTKLSDITALEDWEYEAETDEIPAGSSVEITASYNLSETQKLTKKITISRTACKDKDRDCLCDYGCGKRFSYSSPSSPSSSSSDESPNIEGKNGKKGWSAILDVIEDTKEGEKVVIDMNDATELPKNILKEIKGKDITIVLNMDNGFIWTINGKDVENPKTIDMGVKKGTRIPVKVINEVTGESEYIEITLSHNGDFGFKAVLTVDMGKNNKGNFANLYYYNGKEMDIICSDEIDENGKADLTFTHASEYVIVIDDTDHTDLSAGESIKVEEIVLL